MGANEISYLLELRKKRNELEFKLAFLSGKGVGEEDRRIAEIRGELGEVMERLNLLEASLKEKRVLVFAPHENAIAKLNEELSKFTAQQIHDAMERKEGDAYPVLEKRGKYIKANYDGRKDVAVLVDFANTLPSKIKEEIAERVREGKIKDLDASVIEGEARKRLLKLLNRCGLECSLSSHKFVSGRKDGEWNEEKVALGGSYAWVDPKHRGEVEKFAAEFDAIAAKVQVMNAERTVRNFSPGEEKAFEELQKKYLELVRRRNGLLEG